MIYGLGPRAQRVFTALHARIAGGDWTPGARLPSHRDLAVEFGVAPMTMRQVLAHLEERGLVSRQVGRGTFVRAPSTPAILIIGHDRTLGGFLAEYIGRAGYRAMMASRLNDALTILADDRAIVLALCDLEVLGAHDGAEILRMLRARWPFLPLAALVAALGELTKVFGTAAWPLHILPKPITLGLLDDLLRLVTPQTRRTD